MSLLSQCNTCGQLRGAHASDCILRPSAPALAPSPRARIAIRDVSTLSTAPVHLPGQEEQGVRNSNAWWLAASQRLLRAGGQFGAANPALEGARTLRGKVTQAIYGLVSAFRRECGRNLESIGLSQETFDRLMRAEHAGAAGAMSLQLDTGTLVYPVSSDIAEIQRLRNLNDALAKQRDEALEDSRMLRRDLEAKLYYDEQQKRANDLADDLGDLQHELKLSDGIIATLTKELAAEKARRK